MMAPLRKVGSILFATIAIGSGFFLGFANPIGTLGEPIDLAPVNGGAELVFVYIGSSTCAPSNAPELTLAIERLRESTRAEAERRGVAFATIGIARNRIAGMGIEHLSKYGNWDEILSGRGWLNTGLLKYMHEDFPGQPATPQIVVLERTVQRRPVVAIENETVLVRSVGLQEILHSADLGSMIFARE